jgi:ribosomal protein L30/L7E
MPLFQVTLMRSLIGLPEVYRKRAAVIGLRKRCRTAYIPINQVSVGALVKLLHLTRIRIVDRIPKKTVHPTGYVPLQSSLLHSCPW